jgi:subtilisin family serine protease
MVFRNRILLLIPFLLTAASVRAGTMTPGLEELLRLQDPADQVTVLVVLAEQADIRTLDRSLRGAKAARSQRHRLVAESLRAVAQSSQQDLLDHLQTRQMAGAVRSHRPYWLINAVVVTATPAEIRRLAGRADIERIEPDLSARLIVPLPGRGAPVAAADTGAIGVTPGVEAVGAARVWRELGIDGTGTVVGVIDTGVDGHHPALASRWRGNVAPAQACWLDAAGTGDTAFPVDRGLNGHGTHVMGTITGLAPGDSVGVAPGAQWIASNAIRTSLEELDGSILASLQFMADPDGDPTTSDDVPDVVHNSWGVSDAFTGYFECDSRWWDALDNCEAAGVVLTWSAGNEGPLPQTLRSPADRATSFTNAFSVGSTQTLPPYTISEFSSRGPSSCGGAFAVKPEIVGPGNEILSAQVGGGYHYLSGTSMSGPHVAGVVALMRAANPDADVAAIKEILMSTAVDLGDPGEDNTYGHGFVDAYAAVLAVMNDIGRVTGVVTDAASGLPLPGVAIIGNADRLAVTDAAGAFTVDLPAGPRTFTATRFGYFDSGFSVTISAGGSVATGTSLSLRPTATISGMVRGPEGQPVPGATVTVLETPAPPAVADSAGNYSLALPSGPQVLYELRAAFPGLGYRYWTVELFADRTVDFELPPLVWEDFENGFQDFPWRGDGSAAWTIDSSRAYSGLYSARSGPIGNLGVTGLSLDFYVSGASDLSFRCMVSSEQGYDFLNFYLDGELLRSWSGEVPWTLFTVEVPRGYHNFRWEYARDPAFAEGFDAAWIDLIEFPVTGPELTAGLGLDLVTLAATAPAGGQTAATFTVASEGDLMLDFGISMGPVLNQPGTSVTVASASPDTGSLAPGSTAEITVVFDASELDPGSYVSVMTVASNDPANSLRTFPLILTVTDVSAVAAGDLPPALVFNGAVPNPFNPTTHLEFALPEAAVVGLRIYDVSGRLVRDLGAGEFPAGRNRIRWDGTDGAGRQAASAVYYARLTVAGESRIKTMTLVR